MTSLSGRDGLALRQWWRLQRAGMDKAFLVELTTAVGSAGTTRLLGRALAKKMAGVRMLQGCGALLPLLHWEARCAHSRALRARAFATCAHAWRDAAWIPLLHLCFALQSIEQVWIRSLVAQSVRCGTLGRKILQSIVALVLCGTFAKTIRIRSLDTLCYAICPVDPIQHAFLRHSTARISSTALNAVSPQEHLRAPESPSRSPPKPRKPSEPWEPSPCEPLRIPGSPAPASPCQPPAPGTSWNPLGAPGGP